MQGETLGILPNKPVYSISIHSPYAGGDAVRFRWFYGRCYFNPLPLCRGRHHGIYISKLTRIISIHSPYAGGDVSSSTKSCAVFLFQSTPPMQGETATYSSYIN